MTDPSSLSRTSGTSSADAGASRELTGHGGEIALAALAQFGVDELFTLSGGHIFPLYDAAVKAGVRIIDTRHEQTATFAAEAMAKLTRRPGVAALTAGPGVTNGVSAVTTASFNGSPLVVLGGRAGKHGWGKGALQEFDHVPVFAPITKHATTAMDTASIGDVVTDAARRALTPHRGPVFIDVPIDVIYDQASVALPADPLATVPVVAADPAEVAAAARLIAEAHHPAIIAGTDVYFAGAWEALPRRGRALAGTGLPERLGSRVLAR